MVTTTIIVYVYKINTIYIILDTRNTIEIINNIQVHR